MTEQYMDLADQLLTEIREKLAADSCTSPVAGRRRAVFFADLCGSTKFWREHGEAQGYRRIQFHNWACGRVIQSLNGTMVKELGDGLLATFDHPNVAVQAGLCLIRLWKKFNQMVLSDEPMQTRVAVTCGRLLPAASSPVDFVGEAITRCLQIAEYARPNYLVMDEESLKDWEGGKRTREEDSWEPKVVSLRGLGVATIYEVAERSGN